MISLRQWQSIRKQDGVYAFGAGEPSIRLFNTVLGTTENGRKLLDKPLTKEGIESKEFCRCFENGYERNSS